MTTTTQYRSPQVPATSTQGVRNSLALLIGVGVALAILVAAYLVWFTPWAREPGAQQRPVQAETHGTRPSTVPPTSEGPRGP